jgi:hypothetical protein
MTPRTAKAGVTLVAWKNVNKCHHDEKIHTRTMGAGMAEVVGVGVAEEVEEVEVGVLLVVSVLVTLKMSGKTVVR